VCTCIKAKLTKPGRLLDGSIHDHRIRNWQKSKLAKIGFKKRKRGLHRLRRLHQSLPNELERSADGANG